MTPTNPTATVRAAIARTTEVHPDYWATTVASRQPGGEGSTFAEPFDPLKASWLEANHPHVEAPARCFVSVETYPARMGVLRVGQHGGWYTLRRHKAAEESEAFAETWEIFAEVGDRAPVSKEAAYLIAGDVEGGLGAFTFHPGPPLAKDSCALRDEEVFEALRRAYPYRDPQILRWAAEEGHPLRVPARALKGFTKWAKVSPHSGDEARCFGE